MNIKRRDFVKLAGTGCVSLVAGNVAASENISSSEWDDAYGVLVDTTVCVGCRTCEKACNEVNKLSDQDESVFDDMSVFETHRRPTDKAYTVVNSVENPKKPGNPYYFKVQCMHCNHPVCVSACLVGALRKDKRGPVKYDAWKCMGCRYCLVSCPFQVPAYEYSKALGPEVRKCTFCFDRIINEGKKPACVEHCPTEALIFGKRRELIELAHSRIMKSPDRYVDHVYGEHEIGGTSWIYLAGTDFINTDLPKLDSRPFPELTESIQHGIFKNFIPPIALYGFLGLVMFSLRKKEQKKENNDVIS
ncbi:MAG: 4Fe-4S ferredoxin [candidate division Zixibacteria bacterium 4484_95]|nr:MAG: 4Fe-4S ferredoxin [candidate division Zixibacteria bacterium 4484_95]